MTLTIRPMRPADVPGCVTLINHIVAEGGTTAHEEPFDEAGFRAHYLEAPCTSLVALSEGRIAGFQAVFPDGPGTGSIGSFTDRRDPVKGAGAALFAVTRQAARDAGLKVLLAKIRDYNAGGLAYYTRMGFADHSVDGRTIIKRLDLDAV